MNFVKKNVEEVMRYFEIKFTINVLHRWVTLSIEFTTIILLKTSVNSCSNRVTHFCCFNIHVCNKKDFVGSFIHFGKWAGK